jgi:hypothetical protein
MRNLSIGEFSTEIKIGIWQFTFVAALQETEVGPCLL